MLFIEGIALLSAEAGTWAKQQKDSDSAWAACAEPRWMLWWAEYAGADQSTLVSAVDACVAIMPAVAQKDSYARKDKVAFIAPVIADQVYTAKNDAKVLGQMADAIRGVIPVAPVR